MIEAVVFHQSLKNRDGKWHHLGFINDPEAWAQKAANEYERPVALKYGTGDEKVFHPATEKGLGSVRPKPQ